MFIKQIRIESLGNSSYMVGSQEAGVCAVVDPVRDVDIYLQEAESLSVGITLGKIRIQVLSTPGHTPEHISFLATARTPLPCLAAAPSWWTA